MKFFIVTQNFPPKIGGIQTVMFSVARDLASIGNEVHVFPDHWFLGIDSFKISNLISPKIFRQYIKKLLLSIKQQKSWLKNYSAMVKSGMILIVPYYPA